MAAEVPHGDEDEGDDADDGGQSVEVAQAHEHGALTDGMGSFAEGAHGAEHGTVGLRAEQGHLFAHRAREEVAEEGRAQGCATSYAHESEDGEHLEAVLERHDAFDISGEHDEHHRMACTIEQHRQVEGVDGRVGRDEGAEQRLVHREQEEREEGEPLPSPS